jgi:hypothetical protein
VVFWVLVEGWHKSDEKKSRWKHVSRARKLQSLDLTSVRAAFLMYSCVGPIYVYLGSQISSVFTTWAAWAAWPLKSLQDENPKAANGSKLLLKQPTLRSNVTFKYRELQDATGSFSKKNLIGVGGFAKVRPILCPELQ